MYKTSKETKKFMISTQKKVIPSGEQMSVERTYIVYLHRNQKNGKGYVGWTRVESYETPFEAMARRWSGHCAVAKRGTKFLISYAIRKYGIDAWDHEVLERHDVREDAKLAEIRLIVELKTYAYDPEGSGYNMTRGGDHSPNEGRHLSLLWKQRIGASHLGKKQSQETCDNRSRSLRGKPFSESHKLALRGSKSDAHRSALKLKAGKHLMKPVIQLDRCMNVIAEFSSIKEAALATGAKGEHISRCCRGERKTTRGFAWKLKNEVRQ